MTAAIDATHDPARESWVASANSPDTDFPVQNLPYGQFRRRGTGEPWRIGVAIGDSILDLAGAVGRLNWPGNVRVALEALAAGDLNAFMAAPTGLQRSLRVALSDALTAGSPASEPLAACLVAQSDAELSLPCHIGDFTDFYTGIHHATTVGRLFRPDNPLLPNYKWVPIGYHGRSSSIGVSGQRFARPRGQTKGDAPTPSFGPARRVDIEVELGIFVGAGNAIGHAMSMAEAEDGWFGLVLLNDWSARDIQAWEYQPLGPFLAKSFATTISPWIVTRDALAPFRVPFVRPSGDPEPLPYLDSPDNRRSGGLDITLEAWILTRAMNERGLPAQRLMRSRYADAYWTVAQLLAHHSSNGCNLRPGDLLGSGTQSGPGPGEGGSLLELSHGGKQPIALASGEARTFLEDGDTVILKAWCDRPGAKRIGLGECAGTVLPAAG